MKALTLSQPWATLHVAPSEITIDNLPPKRIESRNWGFPAPLDVAIHAGKGIDKESRAYVSDGTRFRDPFARHLVACGYSTLDCWQKGYRENFEQHVGGAVYSIAESEHRKPLPLGAMIGFTCYVRVLRGGGVLKMIDGGLFMRVEADFGFYDEDQAGEIRWGFISDETFALTEPIITRGYQKLWDVPRVVYDEMKRQYEAAPAPKVGKSHYFEVARHAAAGYDDAMARSGGEPD